MNITIKKMETDEEIRGKGYVHWKAWHEAYDGMLDAAYLESMTLEKCMRMAYSSYRSFQWPDSILVAKDGDRVVGFTTQGAYRDDTLPDAGEVYTIYILAEYYGKGVGHALMQGALEQTAQFPRIALWVIKNNKRAIRFYEKCGFRFDGAEQKVKLGTETTELRMVFERYA